MATQTIIFDKFAFVQSLEKRGFTRSQADDIVTDIALAQLVSKADLRDALSHLKIDLLKFMFGASRLQLVNTVLADGRGLCSCYLRDNASHNACRRTDYYLPGRTNTHGIM